MEVKCVLIESKVTVENICATTYGFRFYESLNCNSTVKVVEDIFVDRDKAVAFMKLINENDLSAVHISDAIEDLLNR